MEESTEGVDWHSDGVDLPRWAAWAIPLATMAAPALGALALIVGMGR